MCDAISHGVHSLEVHLDSQLVVSQLNGLYHIRDPTLLRIFLHVRLLEWQFKNITYIHVPRFFNQVANSYANYVLDFHLLCNMWTESSVYVVFTDGASHHTKNSASVAWVIYTSMG